MIFSITTLNINDTQHYAIILDVVTLNVVMLNVVEPLKDVWAEFLALFASLHGGCMVGAWNACCNTRDEASAQVWSS